MYNIGVHRLVCTPDRAKRKGAGTEALVDLVGYVDGQTLQISSFYNTTNNSNSNSSVIINYLAELILDNNIHVKIAVSYMLSDFLTILPDRYDHQTRLLPYLLDLMTDNNIHVYNIAYKGLLHCGQNYEEEHKDEILEKRQYGIDGDSRINTSLPLPPPFSTRPPLGVRLYTRGNIKRFLSALINELTNWQSKVRIKSVCLLKVIIILCEEHLTIECHDLLPAFIKALYYSIENFDRDLYMNLIELYALFGRYVLPDVYLHFLSPRLTGRSVSTGGSSDGIGVGGGIGIDNRTKKCVLELLLALISGTKASQLTPYYQEFIDLLTDAYVIDVQVPTLVQGAIRVCVQLLTSLQGMHKELVAAHFTSTGRISDLATCHYKLFKFLLHFTQTWFITDDRLHSKAPVTEVPIALTALRLLAELTSTTHPHQSLSPTLPDSTLAHLYLTHIPAILEEVICEYEVDDSWAATDTGHQLLRQALLNPWSLTILLSPITNATAASTLPASATYPLISSINKSLYSRLLHFLCEAVKQYQHQSPRLPVDKEDTLLTDLIDFTTLLLLPLALTDFSSSCPKIAALHYSLLSLNISTTDTASPVSATVSSVVRTSVHTAPSYLSPASFITPLMLTDSSIRNDILNTLLGISGGGGNNAVGEGLLQRIISTFVLSPLYVQRESLLKRRMALIAVVTGVPTTSLEYDLGSWSTSSLFVPSLLLYSTPITSSSAIIEGVMYTLVCTILHSLLSYGVRPQYHLSTRLSSLKLFISILSTIASHEKGHNYEGVLRVPDTPSIMAVNTDMIKSIALVVGALSDTDDTVRVAALQAITRLITCGCIATPPPSHYSTSVRSDESSMTMQQSTTATITSATATTAIPVSVHDIHTPSGLAHRLLLELPLCTSHTDSDSNNDILNELDIALRLIATIDPSGFDTVVRNHLLVISGNKMVEKEEVGGEVEYLSDMISHVQLLIDLSRGKEKKGS